MKQNGYQIVSESLNHSSILLVTGMSGSGKSTYASNLEKEKNYKWIELDLIAKDIMFKKHNIKSREEAKEWKRNHTLKELIHELEIGATQALNIALNEKHNTPVVIEGVGIFKVKDLSLLQNYPIHCMPIISLTETINRKIGRFKDRGKEIDNRKLKEMTYLYKDELPKYKKFLKSKMMKFV